MGDHAPVAYRIDEHLVREVESNAIPGDELHQARGVICRYVLGYQNVRRLLRDGDRDGAKEVLERVLENERKLRNIRTRQRLRAVQLHPPW